MRRLTPTSNPDLLVGAVTGDDAAVWRLDNNRALVVTADFITPVVDDPRAWGQVAAANAVSDVYAMGGKPLLALNLVGWNSSELPTDLLSEVLLGAQDIAEQAGFAIAGGHTVDDPEPKFGLAVVGEADPENLLTNAGFKVGQKLLLSKPLGVGVITTAIKNDTASTEAIQAAMESMVALNEEASQIALKFEATGATDVTGFGLLGHLGRAVEESKVGAQINTEEVLFLPETQELAEAGFVPGGSRRNLEWLDGRLDKGNCSETGVLLLADAQTSGGLLFGIDDSKAQDALDELVSSGHSASIIGSVIDEEGKIVLR
ncbi:MAG: Selenide, water dikinase [Acidimicrobiales bacterium AG-410-I20]|nr:MAG: Selenide, water dikinase [Acidimicrobiales bacterium AG-410-I20]